MDGATQVAVHAQRPVAQDIPIVMILRVSEKYRARPSGLVSMNTPQAVTKSAADAIEPLVPPQRHREIAHVRFARRAV
jgi:hypothetical protein